MFDSVTHPRTRGRFGTGALLSVLLHALALGVALLLSARSGGVPVPEVPLHFVTSLPKVGQAPGAASPAAAVAAQAPTRAHRARTHRVRAPDEAVVGARVDPPELAAPGADAPELDVPGLGSGIAGVAATAVGPLAGVGQGLGGPIAFSAAPGMTEPRRLSGADPVYTRAALEAGVEGTLTARCVITASGAVEDCRIVKGLPHLDRAVLDALERQRYTPVTFRGQPVAVEYVFTFRMVIPPRR
jgi:protein TonB